MAVGDDANRSAISTVESASRENLLRLMSVIDSAMDAIITVDEAQRVVMFNRSAEKIFGVPAAEAIGSPLERFVPERFRRDRDERVADHRLVGARLGVAERPSQQEGAPAPSRQRRGDGAGHAVVDPDGGGGAGRPGRGHGVR